jgi:hypothetical protein
VSEQQTATVPQQGEKGVGTMSHVILFEHAWFHGAHKHVFGREPNLAAGDDSFFNDRVSSIVVLEGHWHFYRHVNFGDFLGHLDPGTYPWVEDVGIPNDQMSSVLPTS